MSEEKWWEEEQEKVLGHRTVQKKDRPTVTGEKRFSADSLYIPTWFMNPGILRTNEYDNRVKDFPELFRLPRR
jgi:hypothetical protein